jgi:catechol 2,3-dioxygenase-like lactoylglutathione lyase family enzyme
MTPLGIDNVFFAVGDLDAALDFYARCGLRLKFRVDVAQMALLSIGGEEPGLVLRQGEGIGGGRLWVEVADAELAGAELNALGIPTERIETTTGVTVEATDPWGNVIGFADYAKRPELAREAGP